MNQAQRKFLIEKIQADTKKTIDLLNKVKPEEPSMANYLMQGIMNGTLELKDSDQILSVLRERALSSGRGNWMDSGGFSSGTEIRFKPEEVFIIPELYLERLKDYKIKKTELENIIQSIKTESDGLIMRIQLASDKTLDSMIAEVDDMGNIALMDTVLRKQIGSGFVNKLLS